MKTTRTSVSKILKARRISAGLSQWEVARALGYTSAQFVSNWERAVSGPPLDKLAMLCRLLRIMPDEMTRAIMTDQREHVRTAIIAGQKSAAREIARNLEAVR